MNFRRVTLFVLAWFEVMPLVGQQIKVIEFPHAGKEYTVKKLGTAYDWVPPPVEECGPYFLVKHAPDESFVHLLCRTEEVRLMGSITMYETVFDDSKDAPSIEPMPEEKWPETKIRFTIRISHRDLDEAKCLPKPKSQS